MGTIQPRKCKTKCPCAPRRKIHLTPRAGKTISTPLFYSRDKTARRARASPRPRQPGPSREPGGGSFSFVRSSREAAGGGGWGRWRPKRRARRGEVSARPTNGPRGAATNLSGVPRSKPTNLGVISSGMSEECAAGRPSRADPRPGL